MQTYPLLVQSLFGKRHDNDPIKKVTVFTNQDLAISNNLERRLALLLS